MAARIMLTDRFIASPRNVPRTGTIEYRDVEVRGLRVRFSATGDTTFLLLQRFPPSRTPTRRPLGIYPDLSLEQAREKAREWRREVKKGTDLKAKAEREKAAAQQVKDATFEHVAGQFIEGHVKRHARASEAERLIRVEFIARFKRRPIGEITRQECSAAIGAIKERGTPAQAHVAFAHLRRLFNWAIGTGKYDGLDRSPMDKMQPSDLIGKRTVGDRVLSHDELRAVWNAAVAEGYPFGSLVCMLILTGCRLREMAELERSEIDLEGGSVVIPAQRMKGRIAHEVPLAPMALELLRGLPTFLGPYVFSARGGRTPIAGFHKPKQRLDAASGVHNWVLHDLRRTCRTRLSALPIEDRVREAMIAHAKEGMHRVYDLHSYHGEKLHGFTLWEARLAEIVTPPPATFVRRKLAA